MLFYLIDDDPATVDVLRMIIEDSGMGRVLGVASNGQDALDCCKDTTFDLILLDENMPGLSGLETLSRIKLISPSTPVVMVTKS